MIRKAITVLVAVALAAPAAAAASDKQPQPANQPAGRFEIVAGQVSMVVAGNSEQLEVVWISDPDAEIVAHDGTTLTPRWAGQLTVAQQTAANDWLMTHDVDCDVDISHPWKETGTYHTFVKNKSWQHCSGTGVSYHRSTLNLQARPNSNEFFYTQETDTRGTLPNNGIRINLSHQCVRAGPYEWRSEGYGTVYFENGKRKYLPVVRTIPPKSYCF